MMTSPAHVLDYKEQIQLSVFRAQRAHHFHAPFFQVKYVVFMHRINAHQMHHISIFQRYVFLLLKVMWL